MLDIPSYRLAENNIFNFRDREWKGKIIENITKMLEVGEKIGVRISSISISNSEKNNFSELKKTNYKILTIILTYQEKDIVLNYDLPWLVNNHFFVGGNNKVTIFQLFDKPLISRNNMIKLRTNIHSFMVERYGKKSSYNWQISMFNKKFPFANLIIAFYGLDKVKEKFYLDNNGTYCGNERLNESMQDLTNDIIQVLTDQTIDKTKLLTMHFPRKTDTDIVEDLKLVTEVDIFSKEFMHTDDIVSELIYGIQNGPTDDCDYKNKRLRFVEQVIYTYLCKDF